MTTTERVPQYKNRARGALLGGPIGDALGTTLEFSHPGQAPWSPMLIGPHNTITGGGPFNVFPGQITDDSHMAAALAGSLIECGEWNPADVMARYARWRTVTFDCGGQTSGSVSKFNQGIAPLQCGEETWLPGKNAAGNGALMRVYPIGVYFAGDTDARRKAAFEDALLTHFDPRCVLANCAYTAAIADAVKWGGTDRGFMVKAAREDLSWASDEMKRRYPEYTVQVDTAYSDLKRDLKKAACDDPDMYGGECSITGFPSGFVRTGFRLAFWELMHAKSYVEGITDCVNRGGDADTNGSIVGGLLGAWFGAEGIPSDWQILVLNALWGDAEEADPKALGRFSDLLRDEFHPYVTVKLADHMEDPNAPLKPRAFRPEKALDNRPVSSYSKDMTKREDEKTFDSMSPAQQTEMFKSWRSDDLWGDWDKRHEGKVGTQTNFTSNTGSGSSYAWTASKPKTSETDPLRVDYVPGWMTGLPGRLGITICPGRQGSGGSGSHKRDVALDVARLRDHFKTDYLISLMEGKEYGEQKVEGLWDACKGQGIESVWFPIKDLNTPLPEETVKVRMLVASIIRALRRGKNVVVHCKGGLGRSGSITACVLRALGIHGPLAITLTRAARSKAIDTGSQERYVLGFAPMSKYLYLGAGLDIRAAGTPEAVKVLKRAYEDAGRLTFGTTTGYVYESTKKAHEAEKGSSTALSLVPVKAKAPVALGTFSEWQARKIEERKATPVPAKPVKKGWKEALRDAFRANGATEREQGPVVTTVKAEPLPPAPVEATAPERDDATEPDGLPRQGSTFLLN